MPGVTVLFLEYGHGSSLHRLLNFETVYGPTKSSTRRISGLPVHSHPASLSLVMGYRGIAEKGKVGNLNAGFGLWHSTVYTHPCHW